MRENSDRGDSTLFGEALTAGGDGSTHAGPTAAMSSMAPGTTSTGKMMSSHIAILTPLLVGLAATFGTIAIHGFVVHTIVMNLRRDLQRVCLARGSG